MSIKRLRLYWLVAPVCAGLLSACSEGGSAPDGPPGPDLTTPEGTILALTDFYNRQVSESALALLPRGLPVRSPRCPSRSRSSPRGRLPGIATRRRTSSS